MPTNLSSSTLLAALLLITTACASGPTPPAPEATLYQRLGGHDAIVAVVDDAIDNVSADPRINQRFNPAGLPGLKKNLVDLVCLRTGGPCTYTGHNMADAHEGMYIRDAEFDALMDDLTRSLNKFKVPPREQREALAALGQMRNAVVGH